MRRFGCGHGVNHAWRDKDSGGGSEEGVMRFTASHTLLSHPYFTYVLCAGWPLPIFLFTASIPSLDCISRLFINHNTAIIS
jgi:hypothetical protein